MEWHAKGVKKSEIHWVNDLMMGSFAVWHPNGRIKVRGQTKDGEVNGKWEHFYSNGKLERNSQNRIGKLVSLKVWLPDGQPCPHSQVEKGNGIWNMYEEDGTLKERRTFRDGGRDRNGGLTLVPQAFQSKLIRQTKGMGQSYPFLPVSFLLPHPPGRLKNAP